MFCPNCGSQVSENARFCKECGVAVVSEVSGAEGTSSTGNASGVSATSVAVGFSTKINDPAFAKYLKSTNKYSIVFSIVIALIAIIGFTVYGEKSSEMGNPQAFFIGLGIGGMFITIAIFQVLGRKRSRTWDGVVIDKKIERKRRRVNYGDEYRWENYTRYTVVIKDDTGKVHGISVNDDDTVYSYYKVGDKVRHHKGLNTYEKYDKSGDTIIFCNSCSSLNNISDEVCFRCKCPLLK